MKTLCGRLAAGPLASPPHAYEEHMIKVADKAGDIAAESKGVTEQGPEDGDHPQRGIAVHARGEDVF